MGRRSASYMPKSPAHGVQDDLRLASDAASDPLPRLA